MSRRAIAVVAVAGVFAVGCEGGVPEVGLDDASPSPWTEGVSPSVGVVDHGVVACDDVEPLTESRPAGPRVDGPLADEPEVAAAQRRRAELRLDSDIETTRRVVDQLAQAGREDVGEPVLVVEQDQINPPMEVMAALNAYQESQLGRQAAGWWIDREAGGVVTVAVTDDPTVHAEALAELPVVAKHDEPVEVVEADHSTGELNQAQQRIADRIKADLQAGRRNEEPVPGAIISAARSPSLNRVRVTMIDDGDGSRRAKLAEVVGDPDLICVNVVDPPQPPEPVDGVRPLAKVESHDVNGALDDSLPQLVIAFDARVGAALCRS